MASKEDIESGWSKDLHNSRGSGTGSRLSLDVQKLKEHGWKVDERKYTCLGSEKVYLTYVNPQGKVVKGAKAVKTQLAEEGILEKMILLPNIAESSSSGQTVQPASSVPQKVQDGDYEPPMKCAKSDDAEQQE